jgi:hypothetical protein
MSHHSTNVKSRMYETAKRKMLTGLHNTIKSLAPAFDADRKTFIRRLRADLKIILDNNCAAGDRTTARRNKAPHIGKKRLQKEILEIFVDLQKAWQTFTKPNDGPEDQMQETVELPDISASEETDSDYSENLFEI